MRRVGIAGAGGLGSNCAAHLVRAGMKKLVIADFDVVNESNLNRQFFFRNQLGQKKVVNASHFFGAFRKWVRRSFQAFSIQSAR